MTKNFIQKRAFTFILYLAFSCAPTTQFHATTVENYTEMGLALGTIPFDIVGHHYATQNKTKRAALSYIFRDLVSILNKTIYFYNYSKLNDTTGFLGARDGIANGAFLIHDLIKLYQDMHLLRNNKESKTSFRENNKTSALSYSWRVALLPALKGLTTFAIALSQDQSYSGACPTMRYSAASAHSLTRLLDEYSELEAHAPHRKKLLACIILNALWLVYELKQYTQKPTHEERHECGICFEEGNLDNTLGCGHATSCRGCLQDTINQAIRENDVLNLRCTHPGCNHTINLAEATIIMNNEPNFAERFNNAIAFIRHCPNRTCQAQFNNIGNHAIQHDCPECNQSYCARCLVPHQSNEENCLEALRRINPELENYLEQREPNENGNEQVRGRRCPGCTTILNRTRACNHMTCGNRLSNIPGCGFQFCYVCMQPWISGHYC